jgi:hypothetical protein
MPIVGYAHFPCQIVDLAELLDDIGLPLGSDAEDIQRIHVLFGLA